MSEEEPTYEYVKGRGWIVYTQRPDGQPRIGDRIRLKAGSGFDGVEATCNGYAVNGRFRVDMNTVTGPPYGPTLGPYWGNLPSDCWEIIL